MIHILFMILKALGILLLILLILLLLAVCSVLFFPVCYQAQFQKKEDGFAGVKAWGRVSWLLGAVALTASYQDQKQEVQIRIFGGLPETWKQRLKKIRRGAAFAPRAGKSETEKPKEKKTDKKGAEQTESVQEEATSKKETVEQKAAVKKEQLSQKTVTEIQKTRDGSEERKRGEGESDPESVKTKKNVPERFWEVAGQLPGKLLEFAGRLLQVAFWILELPFRLVEKLEKKIQAGRRLKRKWRSMMTFLRSKMFREALFHAKKEVLYFLKKAAPKKVTGTVRFGFDDPALTGEALGVLGVIYGKLPKNLSIQPDFEQEILRGDVKLKGNFRMVTAAGIAFRIFRDQNIRKTMRHFKHKEA